MKKKRSPITLIPSTLKAVNKVKADEGMKTQDLTIQAMLRVWKRAGAEARQEAIYYVEKVNS